MPLSKLTINHNNQQHYINAGKLQQTETDGNCKIKLFNFMFGICEFISSQLPK